MKPKALKPGNTIRFVAPSGPLDPAQDGDTHYTEKLCQVLESQGYRTQFAVNLWNRWRFFAGSDEERASDFQAAFDDQEVDAVFCVRGGYGCGRLLPMLDLDRIAAAQKLLLGFSDITAFHLALNRRGLSTLHSPMSYVFAQNHESWVDESLLAAVTGEDPIPSQAPIGDCIVPGMAKGIVIGGCLTLLADACGTPDQPNCDGKIVLLEDVGEQAYRVDARLTQLLNSGAFENVAGFVVGEMTGTNEKQDTPSKRVTWQEVVEERLAPLGKPIIFNFPFGHISNPLTLPLGIRAKLDADAGRLQYLEAACD